MIAQQVAAGGGDAAAHATQVLGTVTSAVAGGVGAIDPSGAHG